MSKWRKKPHVIDAFKWTGGPDQTEEPLWSVEALKAGRIRIHRSGTPEVYLEVETNSGPVHADPGDYIVKGIDDDLYPCPADLFEKLHEPLEGRAHLLVLRPDQYDQFEQDFSGQYIMFDPAELDTTEVSDMVKTLS